MKQHTVSSVERSSPFPGGSTTAGTVATSSAARAQGMSWPCPPTPGRCVCVTAATRCYCSAAPHALAPEAQQPRAPWTGPHATKGTTTARQVCSPVTQGEDNGSSPSCRPWNTAHQFGSCTTFFAKLYGINSSGLKFPSHLATLLVLAQILTMILLLPFFTFKEFTYFAAIVVLGVIYHLSVPSLPQSKDLPFHTLVSITGPAIKPFIFHSGVDNESACVSFTSPPLEDARSNPHCRGASVRALCLRGRARETPMLRGTGWALPR